MRSLARLFGRLLSEVSQLEAEVGMIIGQNILDELAAQAKDSPRLRMRTAPCDYIEKEVTIPIIATSRKTVCGLFSPLVGMDHLHNYAWHESVPSYYG